MYCPNCNKYVERGKFCEECGRKLIENPQVTKGFNIGDANAISGGVHDSHNVSNDSHAITTSDNHSVTTNTTTITNVTHAAHKTDIEILQEKKTRFLSECKRVMEDGRVDSEEELALESLRMELDLDKGVATQILNTVRVMSSKNNIQASLSPIAKIKLKQFSTAIKNNNIAALHQQISAIEILSQNFLNDELIYKYYAVLAIINPELCIKKYEEENVDKYWSAFWSYVAYIQLKKYNDADKVLMSLSNFHEYPEENVTLLATVGTYLQYGPNDAKEYLDALIGETSPIIQHLVDTMYYLIEPEVSEEMGVDEDSCAFYLKNLFHAVSIEDDLMLQHENLFQKLIEASQNDTKNNSDEIEAQLVDIYSKIKKQENKERIYADWSSSLTQQLTQMFANSLANEELIPIDVVERVTDKNLFIEKFIEEMGNDVYLTENDYKETVETLQALNYDGFDEFVKTNTKLLHDHFKKALTEIVTKQVNEKLDILNEFNTKLETTKKNKATETKKELSKNKTSTPNYNYHPKTKKELEKLLKKLIKERGPQADLNDIDVSKITDMKSLFDTEEHTYAESFNGDISNWDVSSVTDMSCMFYCSEFNGDISSWDVSNVTNMASMFYDAEKFNQDISKWDVSNVTNMDSMFADSGFDGDISAWDVSNVTDMSCMFEGSGFNGDISEWDVSSVTSMADMFLSSKFNGDISSWDVSNVINMSNMFYDSPLEDDEPSWFTDEDDDEDDDESPTSTPNYNYHPKTKEELEELLKKLIKERGPQADLNDIDVSKITDMKSLFDTREHTYAKSFNGDISNWDVSNVTDMSGLFSASKFNGDISNWDVSNVTDMDSMFFNSNFNGDISNWDTSNVTNMSNMFTGTNFNGDISNWDTSNVTNMSGMFFFSKFNGDISNWDVSNVTNMSCMFLKSNFNGDISEWDVSSVTSMADMFLLSKFNGDISSWDVSNVINMSNMFSGSPLEDDEPSWFTDEDDDEDDDESPTSTPNYNYHPKTKEELEELLKKLIKERGPQADLNDIDVSKITDMKSLFDTEEHTYAESFNGDISNWDVSSVTDMSCMFYCSEFNGDISEWDVSNVEDMNGMFKYSKFNGDIEDWDVDNVTDMDDMFYGSPLEDDEPSWYED